MAVSQRYVVIVQVPETRLHRVFGPMSIEDAEKFQEGMSARYPHLHVSKRPTHTATYVNAADVLEGLS